MTPTIPTILPGAAGVRLVRTGYMAALYSPIPPGERKGLLWGQPPSQLFVFPHLLSDKDDYTELLGAVDNAFLVAYAIGMFIR